MFSCSGVGTSKSPAASMLPALSIRCDGSQSLRWAGSMRPQLCLRRKLAFHSCLRYLDSPMTRRKYRMSSNTQAKLGTLDIIFTHYGNSGRIHRALLATGAHLLELRKKSSPPAHTPLLDRQLIQRRPSSGWPLLSILVSPRPLPKSCTGCRHTPSDRHT